MPSPIDSSILEKSVRLRITGQKRMSVSRGDIIRELLRAGVLADDITAAFKMEANDIWYVTLTDGVTVQQVMKKEVFRADNFFMTAERCDERRISLKSTLVTCMAPGRGFL